MTMVYSYYEAGRMIIEEEQDGKNVQHMESTY